MDRLRPNRADAEIACGVVERCQPVVGQDGEFAPSGGISVPFGNRSGELASPAELEGIDGRQQRRLVDTVTTGIATAIFLD